MKRQRGMVALELALILPVLLTLLSAVVYFGRLTYNYEVMRKAANDGVRYLSSVAAVNLRSPAQANHESNLTLAIVQTELGSLSSNAAVVVACDNAPCMVNGAVPAEVSIIVIMQVPNVFPGYLPELLDQRLVITSKARYVGN
jgi:Flp pilus assembly protein TadG